MGKNKVTVHEKLELNLRKDHLLREKAYKIIKNAIIYGTYPPEYELTEQSLSDELGISKTPIRDALIRLQSDGFINIYPFKGAKVASLKHRQVIEMLELRSVLEPWTACKALAFLSDQEIDEAGTLIENMIQSKELGDLEEAARIHKTFHQIFFDKLENEYLTQIFNNIFNHSERFTAQAMLNNENMENAIDEYRAIIRALKAKDSTMVKVTMQMHLDNVRKRFQSTI